MKNFVKTNYMATVFDGHSHIERRVYEDMDGKRYVRINRDFCLIIDLIRINKFHVDTWYDG